MCPRQLYPFAVAQRSGLCRSAYGRFGTWSGASNGQGGSGLPAVINIDDGTFQPTGSLLGVGVSTLAQLARPALHPEQVLYRCTPDEAGKLYEFFLPPTRYATTPAAKRRARRRACLVRIAR